MQMNLQVTLERCVGCGKCELACAFAHSVEGVPGISRIQVVRRGAEQGTPLVCLQCLDAACVQICPVQAIERDPTTMALVVHDERCVGCSMCVAACPFGQMHWSSAEACPQKCDLCGGHPQCVPFCPTGALLYCPAHLERPEHPERPEHLSDSRVTQTHIPELRPAEPRLALVASAEAASLAAPNEPAQDSPAARQARSAGASR